MKWEPVAERTPELMEDWRQFTIYPPGCLNKLVPVQVLITFLPKFIERNPEITLWHCLFEPSALVRFQAPNPDPIIDSAFAIAKDCGLEITLGDAAPEGISRNRDATVMYHGEADIYGPRLWEANKRFMHACSMLALVIRELPPEKHPWPLQKMIHLFCNAMGLSTLEESSFHQYCLYRQLEVYNKFGGN